MIRTLTRVGPAAVVLATAAPALGQSDGERKRQRLLEKVARRFDVPVAALDAAGAERYAVRGLESRRAFLRDLGRSPRGELLPILLDATRAERPYELRFPAVKLLSTVTLEAGRARYLDTFLPALPRLFDDPLDKVALRAAEEANHLARWFECDHAVVDGLERRFRGEHYRMAQVAFDGLVDLRHPELRAGPARRALLDVLDPKTRFSVFERKRAVLEAGRRGNLAPPARLAELIFEDGTVAIECTRALAELGEPAVLPQLRRVDRTASHALRIPVYRTRARLGDAELQRDIERAFTDGHPAIRAALVEALGLHPAPEVTRILDRLAEVVTDSDLRRGVALARLRRGNAADVELLARALRGREADRALARAVVDLEAGPGRGELLTVLAGNDRVGGLRARAVDRLGALGVDTEEARGLLADLAEGEEPSALRLRAAASLLQLGHPEGAARVEAALDGLNVARREDVAAGLGKPARRFAGSVLSDVCRRWADGEAMGAVPLLAGWLDPRASGEAGAPSGEDEGPAEGSGTRTRTPAGTDAGGPGADPPEPPPWLAHPFVRREAVRALGALVASLDAGDPGDEARRDRGLAALARALDDPAGVVRAVAAQALARISGAVELARGASLEREEAAIEEVRVWLERR